MIRTLLSSLTVVVVLGAWGCGGASATDPGGPADGVSTDLPSDDLPRDLAGTDPAPRPDTPTADGTPPPDDVAPGDGTGPADLAVLDIPSLPGCPPCGQGTLTGLACAPDGKTVVPEVTVSIDGIDCHGQPFHLETQSDTMGRYTLEGVPCGYQVVKLTKGSYSHEFNAFVKHLETVEATTGRCFSGTAAKIAVITGDWDRLQEILTALKLQYTEINGIGDSGMGSDAGAFLSDWSRLSKFNILFINCGKSLDTGSSGIANLQKFVQGGGSLYASDYAVSYISSAWPNALEFPSNIYSVWSQTVNSDIRDPRLVGYLGKMTTQISYVLGPLVQVDGPGPGTEVHIEGVFPKYEADQNIHPQLLSFKPYGDKGGRVIYGGFHHDEQTKEPGKTDVRNILKFVVFSL